MGGSWGKKLREAAGERPPQFQVFNESPRGDPLREPGEVTAQTPTEPGDGPEKERTGSDHNFECAPEFRVWASLRGGL